MSIPRPWWEGLGEGVNCYIILKEKRGIYHTFGLRSRLVSLPSSLMKQVLRQWQTFGKEILRRGGRERHSCLMWISSSLETKKEGVPCKISGELPMSPYCQRTQDARSLGYLLRITFTKTPYIPESKTWIFWQRLRPLRPTPLRTVISSGFYPNITCLK